MLIFDNIIRKPWYNYDFDFFMEDGELRKIQCFLGKSISSIRQKLNEIPDIEVLEGEEEWVITLIDLPNTDSEVVISKTSPKNLPLESDD